MTGKMNFQKNKSTNFINNMFCSKGTFHLKICTISTLNCMAKSKLLEKLLLNVQR